MLGAVTERTSAGTTTIEPAATYGVVRANHDFRDGESAVGLIATSVHRSLDATTEPFLRRDALTAGVDARHRFLGRRYALQGTFAATSVAGTRSAIARTQRSSVHFYQRPDDDLVVDTMRTSLRGTSVALRADKVSGLVRGGIDYQRQSAGYETNDLGFLSRADLQTLNARLSIVPSGPVARWRNSTAFLGMSQQFTAAGLRNGSFAEMLVAGYRPSGARFSINTWVENPVATYCDRCARGGPALRLSPSYSTLLNFNGNPRLRFSPTFAAIYTVADEGQSYLWRVRPYVTFRPSTRVSAELGTRFQRNSDHTQYLASAGSVGADSTHYLFAHLDQDLLSFTSRLNVTLRPTLSLQMYAEPFVSAGRYTAVREIAAPRAESYADRFQPYAGPPRNGDFNSKSFNASAVVRWEYRRASTLFVVWTQSRDQGDRDYGSFTATRDYRNLFAARPDNVFLVKAAYWLGSEPLGQSPVTSQS